MTLEMALGVYTIENIVAAITQGIAIGLLIFGHLATHHRWVTLIMPYRWIYVRSVTISVFTILVVLQVGQGVAAYLGGDPGWPRAIARAGVWFIAAPAIGFGTWLRLWWYGRSRGGRS